MGYIGTKFEFIKQREEELFKAYTIVLRAADRIVISEVMQQTVLMPCSRFWVTADRAAAVLSELRRGKSFGGMSRCKRAMYEELLRRYCQMRERYPSKAAIDIVADIVESPAPQFYMEASTANQILTARRNKWRGDI